MHYILLASFGLFFPNVASIAAGKNSQFCQTIRADVVDGPDASGYCSNYLGIPIVTKTVNTKIITVKTQTYARTDVVSTVTADASMFTTTVTPTTTIHTTIIKTAFTASNVVTITVTSSRTLCDGRVDSYPDDSNPYKAVKRDDVLQGTPNAPAPFVTMTDDASISAACSCVPITRSRTTTTLTSTITKTRISLGGDGLTTTTTPTSTVTVSADQVTTTQTDITRLPMTPTTKTATIYVGSASPTAYRVIQNGKYVAEYNNDPSYISLQGAADNAFIFQSPNPGGLLLTSDGKWAAQMNQANDPGVVQLASYNGSPPSNPVTCSINVDEGSNKCTLGCSQPYGNVQYDSGGLWNVGSMSLWNGLDYIRNNYPEIAASVHIATPSIEVV